jgi:hypothetical protein
MLDIPDHPVLDKLALIGGCLRLPLAIDASRLQREVAALPDDCWGSTAGRVGVHQVAEAVFLRGYAPAQGDLPVEDRPALNALPYARHVIEQVIPAPALRCLLARLPAGAVVAPHVDRPPYFAKTLRLHFPVQTNDAVSMVAGGFCYSMRAGEVWVLNNSASHAVWNAHATESRTHMICDFLPSPSLLELMKRGERDLGISRADVDAQVRIPQFPGAAANG